MARDLLLCFVWCEHWCQASLVGQLWKLTFIVGPEIALCPKTDWYLWEYFIPDCGHQRHESHPLDNHSFIYSLVNRILALLTINLCPSTSTQVLLCKYMWSLALDFKNDDNRSTDLTIKGIYLDFYDYYDDMQPPIFQTRIELLQSSSRQDLNCQAIMSSSWGRLPLNWVFDKQDGKNLYERLPLDIIRRVVDPLTLKERVRLACVCKAWSTAALKNWTSVDIDPGSVTVSQSPLVLAFLNKLGTHSRDTLQTIQFPIETTYILELPGWYNPLHTSALTTKTFTARCTVGLCPACELPCRQKTASLLCFQVAIRFQADLSTNCSLFYNGQTKEWHELKISPGRQFKVFSLLLSNKLRRSCMTKRASWHCLRNWHVQSSVIICKTQYQLSMIKLTNCSSMLWCSLLKLSLIISNCRFLPCSRLMWVSRCAVMSCCHL